MTHLDITESYVLDMYSYGQNYSRLALLVDRCIELVNVGTDKSMRTAG